MSRRLGILLAVAGVAIAIIGLLFVSLIFRRAVSPPVVATQVTPVTLPVLVTTRALPIRALLRPEDVTVVNMPVEFVPLDAVSEPEQVVGKISMIPLAAGEIVMQHHLADPTNISGNFAFIIGEDQVLMAFPATDLMSQVDVLQPGDLVDILVSINVPVLPSETTGLAAGQETGQQEEELFTFDALQHVTIQAIVVEITERRETGQTSVPRASATAVPTPTPAPNEIQAQAILLAVAPQDALALKHLKDDGGIVDIVLRPPTAKQTYELDPVTAEYLKDRYGLVIQR
jgi:pilus assembly protein CpaB